MCPRFAKGVKSKMAKTKADPYLDHGYNSRTDYLLGLSDEYNVPLGVVLALADVLGPSEDFDGLVTSLEDAEGCY